MDKSELKRIAESLSGIIDRHVRLTDHPVRKQSLFYERESIRRKIDFLDWNGVAKRHGCQAYTVDKYEAGVNSVADS